jgi:hypothetical protein
MRLDQRRLTFVAYRLLYPRLARFQNEIAEFLPRAREYYPFEHFHMDGDSGGVVETEGRKRLEVEREGFQYQEQVTEDFDVVRMNIVHLMTLTLLHFEIPVFIVGRVTLRQRWPMEPGAPAVGDAMRERALKLEPNHFAPLGSIENAGLHLVGTTGGGEDDADQEGGRELHWHLEIDPFQTSDNDLFIQLETYFTGPLTTAEELGEVLQASHDFLYDNVGKFVDGFMP